MSGTPSSNHSHWDGHAPDYSRKVMQASFAIDAAKAAMLNAMREEYPKGSVVRVVHYRGEFEGIVTGWDVNGYRIAVRNSSSGKESKWWAAHVELIGGAA